MGETPHIDDPELERDTERDELNPDDRAARLFAQLVGRMLEPLEKRLGDGDQLFQQLQQDVQTLHRLVGNLIDEVAKHKEAVNQLAERLARLEGQHAARHPRDALPSVPPGG